MPDGMPFRRLSVDCPTTAVRTAAGEAPGLLWRNRAATPATCGAAIDVPLSVAVAVSLVRQVERMLEPGAKMSTTLPKFEKDDRTSVRVEDPTVIASPTRAGDEFAALVFELPAAIE